MITYIFRFFIKSLSKIINKHFIIQYYNIYYAFIFLFFFQFQTNPLFLMSKNHGYIHVTLQEPIIFINKSFLWNL